MRHIRWWRSWNRRAAWQRRVLALAALAALSPTLAGCWDNRPVDARDLVLAIGVSPAPHNDVTVSLAVPTSAGLISGTSPGSGAGGGSSGQSTYLLQGTGPDLGAAIAMAQAYTNKDIYLGQTQLVLFSHRLDATQFGHAVSWLARLGPFDKTAYAAVAEAPVAKTLGYQPVSTRIGPMYFLTLFSCTHCQTANLARTLWSLEMRTVSPGMSIWLPAIDTRGPNFVVRRVVVFRGNTAVATLSPSQTLALCYLMAATSKATLSVSTPAGRVGVRAVRASRFNSVTWSHGRLHVHVTISVMAAIDQLAEGAVNPAIVLDVEDAVSRRIARQTTKVMALLQRRGSDPEAYGPSVFWNWPALRPHWLAIYRRAVLSVSVSTVIHNVGDST